MPSFATGWYLKTYLLSKPRRSCPMAHATSFGAITCRRFVLKNSAGTTNTLRLIPGTPTFHAYCSPHTFSSLAPVFTLNSTVSCRCADSRVSNFACLAQVIG